MYQVPASSLPADCNPVVVGGQFASLCVLPDTPGRWTYVLDNQRTLSAATASEAAARQLKAVLTRLPFARRRGCRQGALRSWAAGRMAIELLHKSSRRDKPRFVFKDLCKRFPVTVLNLAAGLACDKLPRFAKNRTLYRPAPPRPDKPGPRASQKDGDAFVCKAAAAHGPPDTAREGPNTSGQTVTVACWHGLHFQKARDITSKKPAR